MVYASSPVRIPYIYTPYILPALTHIAMSFYNFFIIRFLYDWYFFLKSSQFSSIICLNIFLSFFSSSVITFILKNYNPPFIHIFHFILYKFCNPINNFISLTCIFYLLRPKAKMQIPILSSYPDGLNINSNDVHAWGSSTIREIVIPHWQKISIPVLRGEVQPRVLQRANGGMQFQFPY